MLLDLVDVEDLRRGSVEADDFRRGKCSHGRLVRLIIAAMDIFLRLGAV